MPLTVFFEVFDKLFRWPRDEQMDPLQQNTYTKKVIYIYIYIYTSILCLASSPME